MNRLVIIQALLPAEGESIRWLENSAHDSTIFALGKGVSDTLSSLNITHQSEFLRQEDWTALNDRLYRMLMQSAAEPGSQSAVCLDDWSHFLLSEINHLVSLAEKVVELCARYPVRAVYLKHALNRESFATLDGAVRELVDHLDEGVREVQ